MKVRILLIYFLNCFLDVINGIGSGSLLENIGNESSNKLFIQEGYPKAGDMPLLNRKIYRGTRVHIREHPYIVSVRRGWAHYLTASIISRNLILTIAHPIYEVPLNELGVVVGENYSDRGTSLLTIILVVIHENFDPHTLNGDLAMLRIYEDIIFKFHVKIIPLTKSNKFFGTAMVTGWGRCDFTDEELCFPRSTKYFADEIVDPMLRSISFPAQPENFYCSSYEDHETPLTDGMICMGIGRQENAVAPCLAVPGAPLVINANLYGILSWGFGCGYIHDLPLVYTDLYYYNSWITTNINAFKKFNKGNINELFAATRSYILMMSLNITRIDIPALESENKHLTKAGIDEDLIKLRGHVYDIRDTIYNNAYKEEKQAMLVNLKYIKLIIAADNKTNINIMPLLNKTALEKVNNYWQGYND